MIYVFFACLIPTLWEAWLDRKGETRKGKRKDTIWLLVVVIVAAAGTWRWLGYNPLAIPTAVLVWRVCTLDYLVNFFLKRYSESHRHINVFTYTGKTAKFDKLVAKVHPVLRFAIRLIAFGWAVWWFW